MPFAAPVRHRPQIQFGTHVSLGEDQYRRQRAEPCLVADAGQPLEPRVPRERRDGRVLRTSGGRLFRTRSDTSNRPRLLASRSGRRGPRQPLMAAAPSRIALLEDDLVAERACSWGTLVAARVVRCTSPPDPQPTTTSAGDDAAFAIDALLRAAQVPGCPVGDTTVRLSAQPLPSPAPWGTGCCSRGGRAGAGRPRRPSTPGDTPDMSCRRPPAPGSRP